MENKDEIKSYDIVAMVRWAKAKHTNCGIELSVQSKGKSVRT